MDHEEASMKTKLPKCPICGTNKSVSAIGLSGEMFRCGRCNGLFDNEPNEGGSAHNNPVRSAIYREQRQRKATPHVHGGSNG